MSAGDWQTVLDWVSTHAGWTGAIVFLAAMSESLVVVGVIVPGVALMFGFGALIAIGRLDFWSTCLWAIGGAVAGDGLSFAVGRLFRSSLRQTWPFRNHPEWLDRGEKFVAAHGGKSVLLGRFVGPLRAIVPTVAGMLHMSPARFFALNVLSALAWAPLYLLPGMVFAASMELASQVAVRLAMLLGLVVATIWATLWLAKHLYRRFAPRLEDWQQRLGAWSARHPRVGRLSAALVDPSHSEAEELGVLAVSLFVVTVLLFGLIKQALGEPLPWPLDVRLFNFLQGLRTPWGNTAMGAFARLGEPAALLPAALGMCAWLSWQRAWLAVAHWLAAIGFGLFAAVAFGHFFADPHAASSAAWTRSPSTLGAAMLGFTVIVAARETAPSWRWAPYGAGLALLALVAVARLYHGEQWLSETLAGLCVGLLWAMLLGIAYRRRTNASVAAGGLLAVGFATLLLASYVDLQRDGPPPSRAARLPGPPVVMPETRWWSSDWSELPGYRTDMRGHSQQPLAIQWAGDLRSIRRSLEAHGWRTPPPLTLASALAVLSPETKLEQLPLLPSAHNGLHNALAMTRYGADVAMRDVLRLWASDRVLEDGTPLWVGSINRQTLVHRGGLLTLSRNGTAPFTAALSLGSAASRYREITDTGSPRLLLRSARRP